MNKIKKYLIIGITALVLAIVVYFVLVSYLVTGGFRDYKGFCGQYVPLLEEYHAVNHRYPDDLSLFNLPEDASSYEPDKCRYERTQSGYLIMAPAGLAGQVTYHSETGKWTIE